MGLDVKQLSSRIERTFKGAGADPFGRFKAIVGPTDLNQFGPLAERAREKLRQGELPMAQEMAALELAIRVMRPAPLADDGKAGEIPPECAAAFPAWDKFRALVEPTLFSVGRIDSVWLGRQSGTGFLVSQRLLLTNRHVLDDISLGSHMVGPGQAEVKFRMHPGGSPEAKAILRAVAVHPTADLALLEVDAIAGATPLAFDDQSAGAGHAVVVVGFPANDPRNPFFVPLIFDSKFGLKRTVPGELTQTEAGSVYHDCSTLGGNSGSPVLSMETGRVVGVHREGSFMFRNGAVDAATARAFVGPHLGY